MFRPQALLALGKIGRARAGVVRSKGDAIPCKHWGGPDPESLAHKDLRGERIDLLDGCPLLRGNDGRIVVFRSENSWDSMGSSTTLHDCTGARDALQTSMRDLGQAPAEAGQMLREALAFANKACAQRGRYAWEKGRFVKIGR